MGYTDISSILRMVAVVFALDEEEENLKRMRKVGIEG